MRQMKGALLQLKLDRPPSLTDAVIEQLSKPVTGGAKPTKVGDEKAD